jgi:predicted ATPase
MADEVKFETLGEIKLKGFDGPVEVFAPTGLAQSNEEGGSSSNVDDMGVVQSSSLNIIAGREDEKTLLIDALHAFALSDVGNTFLLEGQAGFGKTSLVNFLREMAVLLNVECQYFSGLELENDTLYYLLRNMTFEFCNLNREEHVIPQEFAHEICNSINQDDSYHSKILMPVLSQFLNMDIGASNKPNDTADREMDSLHQNPTTSLLVRSSAANQIVMAIKDKIFKILDKDKYLFVFNDCHFFDGESWKLLHYFLTKLQASHLILLTTRPMVETTQIIEDTRHLITPLHQIHLKPLTEAAVELVVTGFINNLGDSFPEESLATVRETVMKNSKGNPFWVVQLCKLIRFDGTNLVLELSGGTTESEKLENIVMQQFDQLTSHEQELLKTAAALGASFEINILTNLMPLRYWNIPTD